MHHYPYNRKDGGRYSSTLVRYWIRFWLRFAGGSKSGRLAARFAVLFVPAYKGRVFLAGMTKKGFVEPSAVIHHPEFYLGDHCFIGPNVVVFERQGGGAVTFGNHVEINQDTIIETGRKGSVRIGDHSSIHPRCIVSAYVEPIEIGSGVMIAPNCCIYSYNHGLSIRGSIRSQELASNGPVSIGDESWLGAGVTVLSGVKIGKGAVIGAGSVVADDVPDNAIAAGNPARVVRMRE